MSRLCLSKPWRAALSRSARALVLAALVSTAVPLDGAGQTTIYVDADATGTGDGSSWTDAFVYLQDALFAATAGDEIWVAAGVYRPDQGTHVVVGDRSASFVQPSGTHLMGGFAGWEAEADQRVTSNGYTILTGDLLGNDTGRAGSPNASRQENSLHVVTIPSGLMQSRIDNLSILSGHADQSAENSGGGVYARGPVSLSDVQIRDNYAARNGAGVYAVGSSIGLTGLVVVDNVSGESGGGLYSAGTVRSLKATFYRNEAIDGGAVYVSETGSLVAVNTEMVGNQAFRGGALDTESDVSPSLTVLLVNGLIHRNRAEFGGGIHSLTRKIDVVNTTISFNAANSDGGGIYHIYNEDTLSVTNSILWGNVAGLGGSQIAALENSPTGGGIYLRNTLLETYMPADGIHDGGYNLQGDPAFVDANGPDGLPGTLDDNVRLSFTSPAIDAGENVAIPRDYLDMNSDGDTVETTPADLDFNTRVYDGGSGSRRVDLGAWEFGAPAVDLGVFLAPRATRSKARCTVYPNPARAEIHVRVEDNGVSTYVLWDIAGRTVRQGVLSRQGGRRFEELSLRQVSGPLILQVQRDEDVCYAVILRT